MEKDIISYIGNKAIIKNNNDEILIIKEIGTEKWELPGGKMQNTELESNLKDCLARELREELGNNFNFEILNTVDTMFRIFDKPRNPMVDKVFLLVWEVNYISGEFALQAEEVLDYSWVSKSNFEKFDYINGYKEVISRYLIK